MNTANQPFRASLPPWERALVYAMVAASLAFSLLPSDFSWDNYGMTEVSLEGSRLLQVQWGSLFALSGWLLWRRSNTIWPRIKELNPFLIALIIYCTLSAIWSPLPITTLKKVIQFGGMTALAIVVHDRMSHQVDFRRLLGITLLVIMALSAIVSVLLPRVGVDPLLGNAWRGITQHKNTLGMVAAISVMLWVSGFTRMHLPIKVRVVGLLFSLVVLVMAKSSTALLTAFMGVVILLALRKRVPRPGFLYTRLAIVGVLALVLLLHFFYVTMGRLPTWEELFSVVGYLTGKSSDLTGRNVIWALVIQEIANHPIFGIGFGAFWVGPGSPSDVVTHALKGWHNIYQSHNGYLDMLNEIGIVGTLLFVGMLITYMLQLLQLMKYDRDQALVHWTLIIFLLVSNFSESGLLRGVAAQNLLFIYLTVEASMSVASHRRLAARSLSQGGDSMLRSGRGDLRSDRGNLAHPLGLAGRLRPRTTKIAAYQATKGWNV